jgi:DNA-binding transcriptional LysR family regulator
MELRHLRHFLAVANELNYTRAAQGLRIAGPPLSRSIQQLERELGGALFKRGTRSVSLTQLGLALVPRAERILDDVQSTTQSIQRQARGQPELAIGTRSVPAAVLRILFDEVIRLRQPLAEIRLEPMESYAQVEALLRGRLTFGLLSRRVDDPGIAYLPVMTEALAFALPDRSPFRELAVVLPEHLSELFLVVPPGFQPFGSEIEAYRDAARGVRPVDGAIMGGAAAMIATGDCCCVTLANPDAPWHRDLAGEGTVIRPVPAALTRGTTYLAWRTDRESDDDLAPIIAEARLRFHRPLDL